MRISSAFWLWHRFASPSSPQAGQARREQTGAAQHAQTYSRVGLGEALEVQRAELLAEREASEARLREAAAEAAERYRIDIELRVWAAAEMERTEAIAAVERGTKQRYVRASRMVEMQMSELRQMRRGWCTLSLCAFLSRRWVLDVAAALRLWQRWLAPAAVAAAAVSAVPAAAATASPSAEDVQDHVHACRAELYRLRCAWAVTRLRESLCASPRARTQRAFGLWVQQHALSSLRRLRATRLSGLPPGSTLGGPEPEETLHGSDVGSEPETTYGSHVQSEPDDMVYGSNVDY